MPACSPCVFVLVKEKDGASDDGVVSNVFSPFPPHCAFGVVQTVFHFVLVWNVLAKNGKEEEKNLISINLYFRP